MSEEDAIEVLENIKNSKHIRTELQPFGYAMAIKETTNYTIGTREFSAIETVLNLIQKQQEEIEKLRNKNQDLLRKLRNRVKEVKKLSKYSLYKKEFSRLNKLLEKKDKIIDEMAGYIATLDIEEDICSKTENEHCDKMNFGECEDCIKQYFESKV